MINTENSATKVSTRAGKRVVLILHADGSNFLFFACLHEFGLRCSHETREGSFTVLPDYWIFWAIQRGSRIPNRGDRRLEYGNPRRDSQCIIRSGSRNSFQERCSDEYCGIREAKQRYCSPYRRYNELLCTSSSKQHLYPRCPSLDLSAIDDALRAGRGSLSRPVSVSKWCFVSHGT